MSQECPNCNNKIHDNVKFCPNCGYEVSDDLSNGDFEFKDDFSFTAKTDFSDDFNYDDFDEATGEDFDYEKTGEATGEDFDYDDSLNVDDFTIETSADNDFTKDDFNYADKSNSSSDEDMTGQWIDEFDEDFAPKSDEAAGTKRDIDFSDDFLFEESGSSSTDLFKENNKSQETDDSSDFTFADDFEDSTDDYGGEGVKRESNNNKSSNNGDFAFDDFDFLEDEPDGNIKDTIDTSTDNDVDEYDDFEELSIEDDNAGENLQFDDTSFDDMMVDDFTDEGNSIKGSVKKPVSAGEFKEDFADDFDFGSDWDDDSGNQKTEDYDDAHAYHDEYADSDYYDENESYDDSFNDNNQYLNSTDRKIHDKDYAYGHLKHDAEYADIKSADGDEYEYLDDFSEDSHVSNIQYDDKESDNREYTSLTDMIMLNKTTFLIIIIILLVLFIIMEHM